MMGENCTTYVWAQFIIFDIDRAFFQGHKPVDSLWPFS